MEDFNDLKSFARECGCEADLIRLSDQAAALRNGEYVNAAIVGSSSYENALVLNAAVGTKLRVPSLLPRQEKSLRAAFDRAAEDPRFECISLLHPAWREHGVMLYLLTPEDARDPAMLRGMDVVFYVIPASTPGTQTDKEYLSSLTGIKTVAVLTYLEQAEEGEREQVRDYVRDLIQPLGIECLLEMDKDHPEKIGPRMREQLPLGDELKALREIHCEYLLAQARQQIRSAAEEAIRQAEEAIRQQEAQADAQLQEIRQKNSEWAAVRSQLLTSGSALALSMGDGLRSLAPEFTRILQDAGADAGYSSKWVEASLPREMEQLLNQEIQSKRGALMQAVHQDVAAAMHCAREMGLDTDGTFQDLDAALVIQALEVPDKPDDMKTFLQSRTGRRFAGMAVVGTGAVIVALLNMGPLSGTILAGLAAASEMLAYRYHHSEWKKEQWHDILFNYSRGCCDQAAVALSRSIVDYYESVYLMLTKLSFRKKENVNAQAEERKIRMQEIIATMQSESP